MGMTLETICESLDNVKKLVLQQDCFAVTYKENTIAQLCCLKGMATPVDGYRRMTEFIPANSSIIAFDNKFDVVGTPLFMQTRGIILYVNYPDFDLGGGKSNDESFNIKLKFTNSLGEIFTLPVYNFFSLINNPIITDVSLLLNKVEIINDNTDINVSVEILTVVTNKDGVSIDGNGITTC